jgi:N-acetyl-anhydromuramyl-L-alanine amidase AmpD
VVGLNRHTLSLAFSNRHDGVERLTDAQVDAARWLIEDWRARYPTIEGVLTHAMISPGRKKDPNVIPNFYRHDYT